MPTFDNVCHTCLKGSWTRNWNLMMVIQSSLFGSIFLPYFCLPRKSHCWNSISIFKILASNWYEKGWQLLEIIFLVFHGIIRLVHCCTLTNAIDNEINNKRYCYVFSENYRLKETYEDHLVIKLVLVSDWICLGQVIYSAILNLKRIQLRNWFTTFVWSFNFKKDKISENSNIHIRILCISQYVF